MRKELDDRLCKECPNLYRERNAPSHESPMGYGFPGDGWFEIIYELSHKLESLILAMPEAVRSEYRAVQVKEKFGVLRFYMGNWTDEMAALIRETEEKSAETCEGCGAPGVLRHPQGGFGWIHTYCDPCEVEREKQLAHEEINRRLKGRI